MQQQPMQPEPLATVQCVYCQTTLSYPHNSLYIQCPKCTNTMNPAAPHASFVNCIGCNTLLSHPPTSLTIQCPKCLTVMDLPARAAQGAMMGGGGGGQPDPNRNKSRKKRKDPNAPKRATNAYMVFCRERRASLKEERPDLHFGKLGAKLGEMWRLMSPEEKRPYEARAANDRDRYKAEMGSYQSANMLKGTAMTQLAGMNGGLQGMPDEQQMALFAAKKQRLDDGSGIPTDYAQMNQAQLDAMQQQNAYFHDLQQQQQQQQQPGFNRMAGLSMAQQMQIMQHMQMEAAGGQVNNPNDFGAYQQQPQVLPPGQAEAAQAASAAAAGSAPAGSSYAGDSSNLSGVAQAGDESAQASSAASAAAAAPASKPQEQEGGEEEHDDGGEDDEDEGGEDDEGEE